MFFKYRGFILLEREIDADTSFKITRQILVDEFDDEEFLEFARVNIVMNF